MEKNEEKKEKMNKKEKLRRLSEWLVLWHIPFMRLKDNEELQEKYFEGKPKARQQFELWLQLRKEVIE